MLNLAQWTLWVVIKQVVSELEGRNLHREIVHHIHALVRELHMLKSEISEQVEGESSAAAETAEAIRRDVTQKAAAPTIVEDAAAARNECRAVGDASRDAGRVVEHSHSPRTVANEGQSEKTAVDTVSNVVVEEADGTTGVSGFWRGNIGLWNEFVGRIVRQPKPRASSSKLLAKPFPMKTSSNRRRSL